MKNGYILIDKDTNWTSQDVLSKIKKIIYDKQGGKKEKLTVGHIGTLDPLATGILFILFGKATKLSKYLISHNKEYIAEVQFGILTDTLDITGNIVDEDKNFVLEKYKEDEIKKILNTFIGKNVQEPPIYSALKYNGEKLYNLARNNYLSEDEIKKVLEKKRREINIYEINIINIDYEKNSISFKVKCSSGTYIRSLALDIAKKLNTIGIIKNLRRTKLGNEDVTKAIKIDKLEKNILDSSEYYNEINSIEKLDFGTKDIYITEEEYVKLKHGYKLIRKAEEICYNHNLSNNIFKIYMPKENNKKRYMGILEINKILNNSNIELKKMYLETYNGE